MNEYEILTEMAELLGDNGEGWTSGHLHKHGLTYVAVRVSEDSVHSTDDVKLLVDKYCLVGAFSKVMNLFDSADEYGMNLYHKAMETLPTLVDNCRMGLPNRGEGERYQQDIIPRFNDTQGWCKVKEILDKSIKDSFVGPDESSATME